MRIRTMFEWSLVLSLLAIMSRQLLAAPANEAIARDAGWLEQHDDINQIGATREVDLVLFGDSITQSWGGEGRRQGGAGQQVAKRYYSHRRMANFGISGDQTGHLLWRIQNGNFDQVRPKVIVLMIGVNNLYSAGHQPAEIAGGIGKIVELLREKIPQSKIVLLGPIPAARDPKDPKRLALNQVHELISNIGDEKVVYYRDIGNAC